MRHGWLCFLINVLAFQFFLETDGNGRVGGDMRLRIRKITWAIPDPCVPQPPQRLNDRASDAEKELSGHSKLETDAFPTRHRAQPKYRSCECQVRQGAGRRQLARRRCARVCVHVVPSVPLAGFLKSPSPPSRPQATAHPSSYSPSRHPTTSF